MVWIASTFQSPDYFDLMIFGLIAAVVLAQGSVVRSIVMVLVGLMLSRGSWMIFLERPICAGFLLVSVLFMAAVLLPAIREGRQEAFREE